MSYVIKFGSYTFPAGFHPASQPSSRVIGASKLPRVDGARLATGYLDRKQLIVRGGIIKGPLNPTNDVNAGLDSLRAALAAAPANLYFGRTDRYYRNCQAEQTQIPYDATGYGRIADQVEILFTTGDPFEYSDTATSPAAHNVAASGENWTLTTAGNAPSMPALSVTVAGVGAKSINITITNQTTGESFVLAGSVTGGDVIVVDSLQQTVTISGVDKMALFDGRWISLKAGANTMLETYSGDAPSSIAATWRDRWW